MIESQILMKGQREYLFEFGMEMEMNKKTMQVSKSISFEHNYWKKKKLTNKLPHD